MKKLLFVLCLLVLVPASTLGMTWEEFCEVYGEFPPPPPDASNTDVWPFNSPTLEIQNGDYSDGGQSISDMNAEKWASERDWEGQNVWKYS